MAFVESGGVRLFAEETRSGPAIVWVHQFAADYRTWEGQVRRISQDYRCITYNARGYPPSDVPETGSSYTYDEHREDLLAVLDHFGIEQAHAAANKIAQETGRRAFLHVADRSQADEATSKKTSTEWVDILNRAGVPAGQIYKLDEMFDDPPVKLSGIAQTLEHPKLGKIEILSQPIEMSRTPAQFRRAPPELGQHSVEVMTELGYTSTETAALREQQII